MSWRGTLQKIRYDGRTYVGCSFRGEVFFIESSTESGGRRNVAHEIAFSEEDPYIEDTGKATKTLKIEAYVLGENYHVFRDRLKKALDTKGPGDLVHAYAGKMRVALTGGYTLTQTAKSGGIARFSFEFTKTSAFKFPSSKLDAIKALKSKAATALDVIRKGYGQAYDAANGLNSDFLTPVEDGLRDLQNAMDQPFAALLNGAQELAKFRQRLNNIVENAANLVRSPFDSFDAILDLLAFAFAPPTIPAAFLGLFKASDPNPARLPSPPALTPSREREAELFRLQSAMIKRVHVIRIAEIAADAPFTVSNDAEQVRDLIVDAIDAELPETTDEEFRALTDLKIAVLQAIPGEDRQLQKRVNFTPKVTTPSLVLAYQFYGDTSRELEIVESNQIKHPGFIIGGNQLELVTDA